MTRGDFFETIADDPKMSTTHVVIYLALLHQWHLQGSPSSIEVASFEVMRLTKIRKRDTYLKGVKDLAEFGYIKYQPAENEYIKARIWFRKL